MTVVIAIVLYVLALLVVLLFVGGGRRGDEFHERLLSSMANAARQPTETPRPKRYSPPWSKAPRKLERTPADARRRSAAGS